MALREVPLAIKLGPGVETKVDAKGVPTTRLLALENGVFSKGISIVKRHGYAALSTNILGDSQAYDYEATAGTPRYTMRGLAARFDELLMFSDGNCWSYVDAAGEWQDAGGVMSVTQEDRALAKTSSAQTAGDYAATSGIGVVAWEDSRGGVYYAIVEDGSGRITKAPAQASATGSRPRCVRVGDNLAILWAEAASGQIKIIVVNPSQPHTINSTVFPAVLVDDLVTTAPNYDAEYAVGRDSSGQDKGGACIAWNATGGIRAGWLDPSGVIGSPATDWESPITMTPEATVVAGPAIAKRPWNHLYWGIAYSTATQAYEISVNAALSPFVADPSVSLDVGASVDMVACAWRTEEGVAGTDDILQVWCEKRESPTRNSTISLSSYNYSTGTSTAGDVWRGVALASRAWIDYEGTYSGGISPASPYPNAYVHVVHDVPLFGVYLAMRHDGLCIARTLPTTAGDAPSRAHLPSVIDDGEGGRVYRWVAGAKTQLEGLNNDVFTEQGMRLVSLDFADSSAHQTALAGDTLYLGGACMMAYDGLSWVEQSPHYAPDWETSETLHTVSAGTGSLTVGTHAWVFWYEWTLANGEIVRGPVSKPYTVTAVADDEITFAVPTLRITQFSSANGRVDARVCAARTIAGDSSVYYRITSTNPSATGANGHVLNDTTADAVDIVDAMSDADLLTQEPLYTNGGILSNDPIPGTGIIAGGKERLFTTDPSNGNLVRFSQAREDGYAMEFAPTLTIKVDSFGGDVTALAVMASTLIIFKRSAIYAVEGPGPLPNPQAGGPGDGFTEARLLTTDVGCTEQRSIVTTPAGLMFKSAKGIYLLDTSGSASYIGAPVEGYNDQDIVRATLVDDTTQVRFLTSSGKTLVFDYFFGQWSTWTNHEGRDSVVVAGTYYYLRTDGRVFEQAATYADENLQIPLALETAWIHLHEHLQGYQKIWRLSVIGERKSAHTLRMQYQLDYGNGATSSWSDPLEHDATSTDGSNYGDGNYGDGVYGGTPPGNYQWRFYIGERCQSIRFRFVDVEAYDAAGASMELSELLITAGVIGSMFKLPASRSV